MRLPYPLGLKEKLPLTDDDLLFVKKCRDEAKLLLKGDDKRFVVILGPCSIHDYESTLEYAEKLKALAHSVKETCYVVMRVYLEKSRSTTGWKGYIYDPYLKGQNNIADGMHLSRKLLLTLIKMRIPIATEFVDPLLAPYLQDLISWGFIGARTSTSQPHRQLASHLDFPIGCKNDLSGDVCSAIETVISVNASHDFISLSEEGHLLQKKSQGNPNAYVVLRGGRNGPNYEEDYLYYTYKQLKEHNLHSRILIDCAHGNSQKQPLKQIHVANKILKNLIKGDRNIFGIMIESHLKLGSQKFSSNPSYGLSLTDPCVDWSSSEELLLSFHSALSSELSIVAS